MKPRDWKDARAKVEAEGLCRRCGANRGIQAAHISARRHDQPAKPGQKTLWVNPDSVVPLCPADHELYDSHRIDILPYLTRAEQVQVVKDLGLENARIRTAPLAYPKKAA